MKRGSRPLRELRHEAADLTPPCRFSLERHVCDQVRLSGGLYLPFLNIRSDVPLGLQDFINTHGLAFRFGPRCCECNCFLTQVSLPAVTYQK
jgi:hypothetical protein